MPAFAMSAVSQAQLKYPVSPERGDNLVLVAMRAADVAQFLALVERYIPEGATILDLPREVWSPDVAAPRRDLPDLTTRQREILVLLAGGLSNKQIARRLAISHFTVRNHVSHVLRIFNLKTRRQAMNWFNAIVGPDGHADASPG